MYQIDWYITKHDVYGATFRAAWCNSGPWEINVESFEEIGQDDDIDAVEEAMDGFDLIQNK